MKCAVIGASGQVGQEFAKLLPGDDLLAVTHDDMDITDSAAVKHCMGNLDCDVAVNLAAFHNVNGCEEDSGKAFQTNAVGAGYVAAAAAHRGHKVVYFSSDYVFGLDDNRKSPYVEADHVGPLNTYGASKVAGELLTQAATRNHLIVRSSSLFGIVRSRKGWTFPEMIMQRARAGETLRVVNDQYMSPTYTYDLVRTVIDLLELGVTGVVHVTNAGGCTWYEFANATLELAGIEYRIEAVGSGAFPDKARRPSYSRLDSERLDKLGLPPLRHWRAALREYLAERGEVPA